MKTQIKEITPKWAAQILETRNPRNRPLSETFVAKLARDIQCGVFFPTHQGIAFDENGDLVDGQHRLAAVVMAGRSIALPVTTGLAPTAKLNGSTINIFELIDGGRPRKVGQMLQMAGFPNGAKVAAAVRVAVSVCAERDLVSLSTAQSHKALMYFGRSVERIVQIAGSSKIIKPQAFVSGVAALYHSAHPEKAEQFVQEFGDVTGATGSPSRALAAWVRNHPGSGSGHAQIGLKVAASAIFQAHNSKSVSKLFANDYAVAWLLKLNPSLVQKLAAIVAL